MSTTEGLADDSVFREGNVRVKEEISEFRGRFGSGVRSSTAAEPSPGRVSDESDKSAEISEDTGLVKHAEGEIKARVYQCVTNERKANATEEKRVGVLLERKAERKATNLDFEDDSKRARGVEGAFILKPSRFKGENQEVCNNQAVYDAIQSLESENSHNNRTTDTRLAHVQEDVKMDPSETERNKTCLCKDLEEDKEERRDQESINAKLHGSMASAEQKDAVGVSQSLNQSPVCRAPSLPVFRLVYRYIHGWMDRYIQWMDSRFKRFYLPNAT